MTSVEISILTKRLNKLGKACKFYTDNFERIKERSKDKASILNHLFGDKFDFPSLLG